MSHFLNSKDIGSVTAYGDALTGGYEGSKETFYSYILNQGEFTLPINPSIKPDECTMYIDDVQGDREDVTIPTYASGKIVYDGESHTVVFDDVDAELMDVGGTFTAINAGTYYAEFTLKDTSTYQWEDGGIWKQRLPWTIEKMAGVLDLSDSSIRLINGVTQQTITYIASNTVTAVIENPSYATVSVANGTITVTLLDGASGVTDLTITCAESQNQAGVVKTLKVYANHAPVYGVLWDGGEDSRFVRTDDAENFIDPVVAVGFNSVGSSPFDSIFPWSEIHIEEDEEAGTIVYIPKFYFKWTFSGTSVGLQISPLEIDGYTTSPLHQDRGDGYGERDYAYIGRYLTSSNAPTAADNKRSISGYTIGGGTYINCINQIKALGEEIWMQDPSVYWTMRMLFLVEFADWNWRHFFQLNFAYSTVNINGYSDSMKYHTGYTDDGYCMQYRYIEHFIGGNASVPQQYIAGAFRIGSWNIYACKDPNRQCALTDSTTRNRYYKVIGTLAATNSYIKSFKQATDEDFNYFLIPKESVSDSDKYVTDYTWRTTTSSNYVCLYRSGSQYGLWGMVFAYDGTDAYPTRLMKLPNA